MRHMPLSARPTPFCSRNPQMIACNGPPRLGAGFFLCWSCGLKLWNRVVLRVWRSYKKYCIKRSELLRTSQQIPPKALALAGLNDRRVASIAATAEVKGMEKARFNTLRKMWEGQMKTLVYIYILQYKHHAFRCQSFSFFLQTGTSGTKYPFWGSSLVFQHGSYIFVSCPLQCYIVTYPTL